MRFLLSLTLIAAPALATPVAAQLPEGARDRIDRFVTVSMEEVDLVPGLSLAIVRGEEIVHAAGFGWADVERREPATPGTVYYIASMSKALTGMGAAVLAAEGVLDLDDPITRYFPSLRFGPRLAPADSTSVRDLLNHTPRFMNGGVNFYTTFVGRYEEEDLVRVLSGHSTPSEGFAYSNMSYALASEIMGRAGGRAWQDVLDRWVFDPVGMRSTTAYASRLPIRGVAVPYLRTDRGFEPQPPLKSDATITGAGGFFSTARDLGRYVVANLNDGRVSGRQVLPPAAVREARSPQAAVSARFFEFDRHAYGLGLYVAEYDGDTLVHHFGGIPGGFRSHLSFMPEHGIGVVVLQNAGGVGSRLADIVATFVYDLLLGREDVEERARRRIEELRAASPDRIRAETSLARGPDSVATLRHPTGLSAHAYLGRYENDRLGRVLVHRGSDGLRILWGEIDAPMIPLGGHDFFVPWQPGYAAATWSFRVGESRVEGFDWGGRPFRRLTAATPTPP